MYNQNYISWALHLINSILVQVLGPNFENQDHPDLKFMSRRIIYDIKCAWHHMSLPNFSQCIKDKILLFILTSILFISGWWHKVNTAFNTSSRTTLHKLFYEKRRKSDKQTKSKTQFCYLAQSRWNYFHK